MELNSVIKDVLTIDEMCTGTVVLEGLEGTKTRVRVEVEVVYSPVNDTIGTVKRSAAERAISACEELVSKLKNSYSENDEASTSQPRRDM